MYCLVCGNSLAEDAPFCLKCGTLTPKGKDESGKLGGASTLVSTFPPSSNPYDPRLSTSYGPQFPEGDGRNPYGPTSFYESQAPLPPPPPPRRTFSGALKGLFIGTIVILLLGGGLGGFLLLQQGAPTPSAPHPAKKPTVVSQGTASASPIVNAPAQFLPGMWTPCALENAICNFRGAMTVAFGVNGTYIYTTKSDGTVCTNTVFGDPLYGVNKSCYIEAAPPTANVWTKCAVEGAICSFQGAMTVAFGANGSYKYVVKTNGSACTIDVFGDPLRSVAKSCYVISPPTGVVKWNICAAENSVCTFTGSREVAYGANGTYFYGNFTNETACNNSVFGDPVSNVGKTCYYQ